MQKWQSAIRIIGIAAICASQLFSCRQIEKTYILPPENIDTIIEEESGMTSGVIVHADRNEYDRNIIELWVQADDATYHLAITKGQYFNFNLLNPEGAEGRTAMFPKNQVRWDTRKGEVVTTPYFVNEGHYGTICSDLLRIVDPLGDDITDQLAKKQ
ncbi:MAG: hypothetical protein ABII01_04290 [Candidatus Woesearchaeota archaeon]